MVAVQHDRVWLLDAMCTHNAHVVDERQLPAGDVRKPDEVDDVWHHVWRLRHVAMVIVAKVIGR